MESEDSFAILHINNPPSLMIIFEPMKTLQGRESESHCGFDNCAEPQAVLKCDSSPTQIHQGSEPDLLRAFVLEVVEMMVDQEWKGTHANSND